MKAFGLSIVALAISLSLPRASFADVERYKDETAYIARLTELGYLALTEDFESADWDHVRSNYPVQNFTASVTSQQLQWSSAGNLLWSYPTTSALISTNGNWARGAGWGIFDNFLASTLRIVAPGKMYGIGFWVNTNPDLEDVGILFQDRTVANEPGYIVTGYGAMYPGDIHPSGHGFVGFIDPDGFTEVIVTGTLEVNEDNQLEGGTVFGADDFSFAVPSGIGPPPHQRWLQDHFSQTDLNDPTKEATVWGNDADPDYDGKSNWCEYLFGGDPTQADAAAMALSLESPTEGADNRLQFTYNRRTNDPDLVYKPMVSSDLKLWLSGPSHVEEVGSSSLGDDMERVTCRDTGTLPDPNCAFGQVSVETSP